MPAASDPIERPPSDSSNKIRSIWRGRIFTADLADGRGWEKAALIRAHPCHNPSKSSHAEQIIGVEKGEMSTAEDPGALGQREMSPFFPASA
jgi:hypothetical protein